MEGTGDASLETASIATDSLVEQGPEVARGHLFGGVAAKEGRDAMAHVELGNKGRVSWAEATSSSGDMT